MSPSHSSLAAKKALGVNLPPQVLSVISVAAHGTGQHKQQEDNSKRKIQRLPDGMATGKASVYRSAQNRHTAKVMGCFAYLLQTVRWLQTQAGDEAERSVAASPANIPLRKSATHVSRQVRASYTRHCASVT